MKYTPILFNADMVRAILEGRKTQTRRPYSGPLLAVHEGRPLCQAKDGVYRKPVAPWSIGDRLWVRETFFDAGPFMTAPLFYGKPRFQYRADGYDIGCHKWCPSIHMPREASRITLEITDVRVEPVQKISEADAIAEGVEFDSGWEEPCGEGYTGGEGFRDYQSEDDAFSCRTAFDSYRTLWDALYAAKGPAWSTNPWVWVIEFRRVEA